MAQHQSDSAASVDAACDDVVGNPGYLNDRFLMRLATKIGDDYLQLGVYLGLAPPAIQAIHADHARVVACEFYILTTWRQKIVSPDSMAAFNGLCDAFTDMERTDLVELVTREAEKRSPTPGATAKTTDAEQIKTLQKELETAKKEKLACRQKSEEEIRRQNETIDDLQKHMKSFELKINALTTQRIETLTSVAQFVKGESDDDAGRRRLEVLRLLREYEDPTLWRHVSALVAKNGCLDVSVVIKSTDVPNLEYLLTSGVANDLRVLNVGGGYRGHEIDTWRNVTSVRRLCNGLKHLGQLTHLELRCCQLTDVGFRVVTETLQSHCQALTKLRCWGNDITDESSAAVTTLLINRTKLTVLLQMCRLSSDVRRQLKELFGDRIYVGSQLYY